MSESQINKSDKVHYGEYDSAGGGVLPGELVEQQPRRTYDNKDKTANLYKVSKVHLAVIIAHRPAPPRFYLIPPAAL